MEENISTGIANPELFERMYLQYQLQPRNVDLSWQKIFNYLSPLETRENLQEASLCKEFRIKQLLAAYRGYGYLFAKSNPMVYEIRELPKPLNLSFLGFSVDELDLFFPTLGIFEKTSAPLREIVDRLQAIYCGTIGYEYMGIRDREFENWLQTKVEKEKFVQSKEKKVEVAKLLIQAELLETFIHTKYSGQTRFSLEGAETIIPMLVQIMEKGLGQGIKEIILGMSHRGRINVLGNIMNKPFADIFAEFEQGYVPEFEGSGDVKYHLGYVSEITMFEGGSLVMQMTANPSHLESVDPVVEGQVRAKCYWSDTASILPLLIHGDASLSGQGIVYETMQLSGLPGYKIGGTVHIVINNQIGFTTSPVESRSTRECTDLARIFSSPVFHVNAEDPEACLRAVILAMEVRAAFHCDVFIDLYCYRKYGHNEGDEPTFTQPVEYQLIRQKQTIKSQYCVRLIEEGIVESSWTLDFEKNFKQTLEQSLDKAKKRNQTSKSKSYPLPDFFSEKKTGIPKDQLDSLAMLFTSIPEGFYAHPKIKQLNQERLAMIQGEKKVDWGLAETLAISSLLKMGTTVRIVGQDSSRGTFSQRHVLWVDQKTGEAYYPLAHLQEEQGRFEIVNSPLSEYAALAFEYGYSLSFPNALVIWEAQYGDFCNGAQVIIDQYLSSGEQKWGYHVPLVLLLPHGYEGQGPEHSSARMERFLALAGNENMIIVNPSTSLQYFHLLRRHILSSLGKPLIIFTPKALLRNKESAQPIELFTQGYFQTVILDPSPPTNSNRLIFCSGKVYFDLIRERSKMPTSDIEIVRIEQLYPLDIQKIASFLRTKNFSEYLWVQEEPSNMGAWQSLFFQIQPLLPQGKELIYVGRERSASVAAGSYELHKQEYNKIIKSLFNN